MKIKKQVQPKLTLQIIQNEWSSCTKCEIGKHVRHHVFLDTIPSGLNKVDVIFIGEGPGQIEDVKGLPFVGPAGQLLRKAIVDANPNCRICDGSGYDENAGGGCDACRGHGAIRVGFLNLLVCRPYAGKPMGTGNRPPNDDEVWNCIPRLLQMIKQLNPSFVFLAGKEAQSYIPAIKEGLSDINFTVKEGYIPIKHPSALLRQGGEGNPILYQQYVQQIGSYFDRYFDGNQFDAEPFPKTGSGETKK